MGRQISPTGSPSVCLILTPLTTNTEEEEKKDSYVASGIYYISSLPGKQEISKKKKPGAFRFTIFVYSEAFHKLSTDLSDG